MTRNIVACLSMLLMFAVSAAVAFAPGGEAWSVAACVAMVPCALLATPWLRSPTGGVASGAGGADAEAAGEHGTPPEAPEAPQDPAEFLAFGLLLAGPALAWRLAQEATFADPAPLAAAAVAGGALLAAWALAVKLPSPALRVPLLASLMLLAGAAYGWINVQADAAPPRLAQAAVTMRDPGGRRVPFPPRLRLGPTATETDWAELALTERDRAHLFVGSTACIAEHTSRFGMRWAEVHPCADDRDLTAETAARRWLAHVQYPAAERLALARQLIAGDWRSVDDTLAGVQHRFEAGQANDADVEDALSPFASSAPVFDAPIAAWLAHAPRSYVAHVAAALHAREQSVRLADSGFDAATSPRLNAGRLLDEGRRQAALADTLAARPSMSVWLRYRLTRPRREDMDGWLRQALAADPDDLLMRREYLRWHPLCPCRGEPRPDLAMQRVLATPASARVREALTAYRLFEHAADIDGTEESGRLYEQVLALHATPQELYSSGINLAVFLQKHGHHAEALARLDAAIALRPSNVHAHDVRGWVHESAGEYPPALADYLADARHSDVDAQHQVGRMLLWGEPGIPKNLPGAARWISEAAYNGEADARNALRGRPLLLAEVSKRPVRDVASDDGDAAAAGAR